MTRMGLALIALLLLQGASFGVESALRDPTDPRIRIIRYDPNEVFRLVGTLGYAISIEFDRNEKIENVSIGDSQAWQVTPNRHANLLFVKPMRRDAATDMAVYTNLRRYMFDLDVGPDQNPHDPRIVFGVRFDYPEPAIAVVSKDTGPATLKMPADVNHAYSYQGSARNLPTRVFDDGHSTYFTFSEQADYPAIFVVDPDDQESVANVSSRDGYLVVDRIARAFVLRRGQEVTKIVNDGFKEEGPGPLSPKPRAEKSFFQRWFQ